MTRRSLRAAREAAAVARADAFEATIAELGRPVLLPVTVASRIPAILRPPAPPVERATVRLEPLLPGGRGRRRKPVRHARVAHLARVGIAAALMSAGSFVVTSAAVVTAAVAPPASVIVADEPEAEQLLGDVRITSYEDVFPAPDAAPPLLSAPVVEDVLDVCGDTAVTTALAAGDDAGTVAASGGAATFREAVALGSASCIPLDDPARVWVVVDKTRPFAPLDYRPASLAAPDGVRNVNGDTLRTDAAAALSAMTAAARDAGAGEIALASGFRAYETQVATYESHVARRGADQADLVSARPGYSEHQSGLAADVVPCDTACGTIDDLAATTQGAWVAANAWQYGWIVRYEEGHTDVTGYLPEPWHLRYIGVDLAREYHEGGWRTLEEFFGLPAAPHYDAAH